MERDCRVNIEVLEGDEWFTVWESRPDEYGTSDLWHLAYTERTFQPVKKLYFGSKMISEIATVILTGLIFGLTKFEWSGSERK